MKTQCNTNKYSAICVIPIMDYRIFSSNGFSIHSPVFQPSDVLPPRHNQLFIDGMIQRFDCEMVHRIYYE